MFMLFYVGSSTDWTIIYIVILYFYKTVSTNILNADKARIDRFRKSKQLVELSVDDQYQAHGESESEFFIFQKVTKSS